MYIKDQLNLTLSYLFATKGGKYIRQYVRPCDESSPEVGRK